MILTCPECATRYFVEDSRLGATGRTVRCAACGSSWRAQAEEPLELTLAEEGAIAREPQLSFTPEQPAPPPDVPKIFRAKVEQRRRLKEAAAAGVVWAGMVSGFAALLAAAYVFRVDVVKLYPRAAGAYAMAGVPVNPTGLEFERVKAEPGPAAPGAVLVSGQVRNVENQAAPPPPIRVALLDAHGKELATRVVRLPARPIAPGKALAFSASLPDPRGVADDVAVEFALDLVPPPPKPKPKAGPSKAAPPKAPKAPQAAPARPASPPATLQVAPLRTASPVKGTSLRPALAVAPRKPVEARPLPADDPYALDTAAAEAVSGRPHG